jgi:hypothetical protein
MMNVQSILNITVAFLALTLYGCSSDSTSTSATTASTSASYEIIMTNLTSAQPISPVAVILHTSGYSMGNVGTSASIALEKLAEGGDNSMLLSEANANASVLTSMGGAGILMPAASETITASVNNHTGLQISLAGMLVNTNDGFAAISGLDISTLAAGDSQTVFLPVFDAGTEANVETAASIPGQGGTGFDAARNDVGFISIHRGVVTADDGLATSGLNASHRFDNPALKVVIRRIS